MNEPEPVSNPSHVAGSVFISYATADRKQALSVCKAIERRGLACWISSRDVAPGDNYQEAIVQSIRTARAMVLLFSARSNHSDEIKKELSLASRYRVPVITLRLEDVEPSDAFAYELSTRQWIDAFDGWDRSIDLLANRISEMPSAGPAPARVTPLQKRTAASRRPMTIAASLLLLLAFVGAGWWLLRPSTAAAHSMVVRLGDFQLLSANLPSTTPAMVREEMIGAFGDDGVIRVSTASQVHAGTGPSYVLSGTIRRDGRVIRVITRLTNERSGVALWIDTFDYDGVDLGKIPRRIAVDAGNMVHCGLFAASTYHKPLPDAVLSDYMQFCQNSWWSQQFSNPEKALDAARKVAAAAPDFSWGMSAITVASQLAFYRNDPGPHREELRRIGIQAADKALSLDAKNSEALAQKSMLIGRLKWSAQEQLLRQAIAARPLFCGCEHYLYGVMLTNVGRYSDAVSQMRRSTELLALDGISQFGLADALRVTSSSEEARVHLDAAIDLFREPTTAAFYTIRNAPETRDYAGAIEALADTRVKMSAGKRAGLLAGFRALKTGEATAKSRAVDALSNLPDGEIDSVVTRLLGLLGANDKALRIVETKATREHFNAPSWLWYPSMRGALNDAAAGGVLERLQLVKYWRASHTKPDVCSEKAPPPFCKLI